MMKIYLKKITMYFLLFISSPHSRPRIYNKYLGVRFGQNVRITHFPRFGSEPFLIEIGNNVTITRGVSFLTHDGGVALFRNEVPGLNYFGKIIVGNNVFIGINSTIMPAVKIGNNVVIASGSIVTKDISDDVVVGGIPAKKICSINEYKEKILSKSIIVKNKAFEKRKNEILEKLNLL